MGKQRPRQTGTGDVEEGTEGMTEGNERREFQRSPLPVDVVLVVGGTDTLDGSLSDLSLKGALIHCDPPIPAGMDLRVAFYVEGRSAGLTFDVNGCVVRATAVGIAVEFTGVQVEAFRQLQELVARSESGARSASE